MCPAISSTSSFPTLLLVLLSLRPGLQYPTPSQHWNTDMCNDTIRELFQELERLTEKSVSTQGGLSLEQWGSGRCLGHSPHGPLSLSPQDSPGVEVQMLLCVSVLPHTWT